MVDEAALSDFVKKRLAVFHRARDKKISTGVSELLARKNPYLYRYLGFDTTKEMVDALLAAWLSSSDETMFGKALEDIAIYLCAQAFGGSNRRQQA